MLSVYTITPTSAAAHGLTLRADGTRRDGHDLLAFPEITFDTLIRIWPELAEIDPETQTQLSREALYRTYIARQERDIEALKRDEAYHIPVNFNYKDMPGLSAELTEKLDEIRPRNLAQAGRIEGMTPAALTLLLTRLRQIPAKSA